MELWLLYKKTRLKYLNWIEFKNHVYDSISISVLRLTSYRFNSNITFEKNNQLFYFKCLIGPENLFSHWCFPVCLSCQYNWSHRIFSFILLFLLLLWLPSPFPFRIILSFFIFSVSFRRVVCRRLFSVCLMFSTGFFWVRRNFLFIRTHLFNYSSATLVPCLFWITILFLARDVWSISIYFCASVHIV